MGKNYFLKSKPCNNCGHCQAELHIGKSSFGGRFLFRSHMWPTSLNTFSEWLLSINNKKKVIFDEYGEIINKKEFINMVNSKQNFEIKENSSDYFYVDGHGYQFCKVEFC